MCFKVYLSDTGERGGGGYRLFLRILLARIHAPFLCDIQHLGGNVNRLASPLGTYSLGKQLGRSELVAGHVLCFED